VRRVAVAVGVLLVVVAACGHDTVPLDHLTLPSGYQLAPVEQGEPAAFRRQYRADAGATDVVVHRVDTPTGGPGLVVVALAWPHPMGDRVADVARRLANDVPIGGSRPATVAGHPAQVHQADDTFQSTVLAVDGRRGVLVYGGTLGDAEVLAEAALRSWR
jgi:hypothetical protein